jgi:hypothetical protein
MFVIEWKLEAQEEVLDKGSIERMASLVASASVLERAARGGVWRKGTGGWVTSEQVLVSTQD